MASLKCLVSVTCQVALLLLLLIALAVQTHMAQAQTSCTSELSNLNVCAPFVVPGATNTNPSADCCGALQSVQHDCLCNTLRIAARLPSQCNLPPLSCGN
ncbi:LTP_2 domain-containing protein [Cephalotus follicularis]|uniref:LTP_2 domain-containing protein n=1 Tax=Cephalotus follicularis TaxID=3775 RepID=A0A1Q3BX90_CEPFO|nr:LTP_2 domain-containing protein [Cephalotus follicularis]